MRKTVSVFSALFIALIVTLAQSVLAAPPDLTAGGVPDSTQTVNLGPTGMRGWVYHAGVSTTDSRQILVTAVDAWSPADTLLQVDDVILGADGTGSDPTAFTSDAYRALADAIGDAEGNNPAVLKLRRWRSGSTQTVTLTLTYMGTYGSTAPYGDGTTFDEKTANVLEKGLEYIMNNAESPGRWQWGALNLLAANDPSNPDNTARQTRARDEVYELIPDAKTLADMNDDEPDEGSKNAWDRGHKLVVLAEYYYQTNDATILPALQAYAHSYAIGQSMWGTTGHIYAHGQWPDNSAPGRIITGYGAINMTATTALYGLQLAKECGVNDPEVDAAIVRASRFFRYYYKKGSIPYGEHPPGGGFESQGKMAILALAYEMQSANQSVSKWFSRCSTAASGNGNWFGGHTGPYFQQFWPTLGAAVGGEGAATARFLERAWHYDMMRRWDGSFVFDSLTYGFNGSNYNGVPASTIALVTYALPLQQLRMTGRNQNLTPLTSQELSDTVAASEYDASAKTTADLLTDLGNWSHVVRAAAASELANRVASDATILPAVTTKANDTGAGDARYGAVKALGSIADPSSAPVLGALLTDDDNYVRQLAADALGANPDKASQVTSILKALASTARPLLPFYEEDPMQTAHGQLVEMAAWVLRNVSLNDLDPTLLYPALRAIANTPRGHARSTAVSLIMPNLSEQMASDLADMLVDAVYYRSPADSMFAGGARTTANDILEQYHIAEGVPLAVIMARNDSKLNHAALDDLKAYEGAGPLVEPDAGIEAFLDSLGTAYADEVKAVRDAIAADPFPTPCTYFKNILAVTADDAALELPATTTTLRVSDDDKVGDAIFTWRKVHGAGDVLFTPNGTDDAQNTLVVFDGTPGTYEFEVTMGDPRGLTERYGTVSVTLEKVGGGLDSNPAPTANDDSVTVIQATPKQITLTASDAPQNYSLLYTVTRQPEHGSLTGDVPYLTYQSALDYTGADSFTFQVMDSEGQTDSATISITVEAGAAVGLAVYEPFDYPAGNLDGQSGSSEIGLTGTWVGGTNLVAEGSLQMGPLPTLGGQFSSSGGGWVIGGTRALAPGTLNPGGAYNLLGDGNTLWFSCVVGYAPGIRSGGLIFALASDSFVTNGGDNFITNGGNGLGFTFGGTVNAKHFGSSNYSHTTGTQLDGNTSFATSEYRLLVAKINWGIDAADPDRIELYNVGSDMLLPAAPIAELEIVVDQSAYDTLTFKRSGDVILDEIRFGDSFQSVTAGTTAITPDTTAPIPNPPAFATAPEVAPDNSVYMAAVPAYDPTDVEYYFTCTGGGGNDSGWQSSNEYTDTGLTPGTLYTYTVKTRDLSPSRNVTPESTGASVTIPATRTVPDVVGLQQPQAEAIIVLNHLTVGAITGTYSDTVPVGEVMSQTPAAESTAGAQEPVDLEVSLGRDSTQVPILVSISDDKSGGPVEAFQPITYTVTFSEDMDDTTVDASDFENGVISGGCAINVRTPSEIAPGVFSLIVDTTSPGNLQLRIKAGAVLSDVDTPTPHDLATTSAIADDTTISVNPVGLAIYEPFDYPAGNLGNKSGTSDIGLDGVWSSYPIHVRSDPQPYGILATLGRRCRSEGGYSYGSSRGILSSALENKALLADGATLWFSVLVGNYDDVNGRLGLALANNEFDGYAKDYYILDPLDENDVPIANGEGIGFWFGNEDGAGTNYGRLQAAYFGGGIDGESSVWTSRVTFGDWNGTPLASSEFCLLVGKITWAADPADPDTVELYRVPAGTTMPAEGELGTPVSTLNTVAFDQSIINTLTFNWDNAVVLDEIRFGGTYDSVVPVDSTKPTITNEDFVDNQGGGPVVEDITTITYTVTFSEDIDETTVTAADFENRETTPITIGTITEISEGVFTVEVTPTDGGLLRLQIAAGAEIADIAGNLLDTSLAIPDDTLITVNLNNTAPVWSADPISTPDASEGVEYSGTGASLAGFVTDPDSGDTLIFAKVAGESWLAVAADGTLSGTPPADSAGVHSFTVSVDDGNYDPVEVTLNIYVSLSGVTAPTLNSMADDQSGGPVQMGDLVTYTLTFSENMDATSIGADDFSNAGTSLITIGSITVANNVVTVEVTPTGGTLHLQVPPGAVLLDQNEGAPLDTSVAIVDDTEIIVNPPPLVIYEPFDYYPQGLGNIDDSDSLSDFGLSGPYTNAYPTVQVYALSAGYGNLKTMGNKLRLSSREGGGTRAVSQPNLTNTGLLNDGNTLWFSMVIGNMPGEDNGQFAFALANSRFALGVAKYWIENWEGEEPSGVGFFFGNRGYIPCRIIATQFRGLDYGDGRNSMVFGASTGVQDIGTGEHRLIVGKLSWAEDPAAPDTLEIYMPGPDMLLPASPITSVSCVVDQSTYDTMTMTVDNGYSLIDEIRFGSTYSNVVPLDTTPPTLAGTAIVDDRGGADIVENQVVTYTVTFSEQMDLDTIEATDFTNAGNAEITINSISQPSNGVITVEVTPVVPVSETTATLHLQVPAGAAITDLAGNALDTSSAIVDDTTITVLNDVQRPTVVSIVNDKDGETNVPPNGVPPIIYTITFDKDMNDATVEASDFSNAGSSAVTFGSISKVSGTVYQLPVTPTTGNSTLHLQIYAGAAMEDLAGNPLDTAVAIVDDTILVVTDDPEPVWNSDPVVEADAYEDDAYVQTLANDAQDWHEDTQTWNNDDLALVFKKLGGPSWLQIAENGDLSGTPRNEDVGLNTFTVSVTDGISTVQATLQITVINVNDAPVFDSDPVTLAAATEDVDYAGQSLTLLPYASDEDGDMMTFAKTGGPNWLTVNGDGSLSGTPDAVNIGVNTFTVQVTDGNEAYGYAELNIEVISANDAPVFNPNPINLTGATEHEAYTGTIAGTATDEENDPFSYSKVAGPEWLVIAADGTLSGTPDGAAGNDGQDTFTVEAEDIYGAAGQATLTIAVTAVPDAPEFPANPFSTSPAKVGVAYSGASIAPYALDLDEDSLTFSKVDGPNWLNVAGDGTLSGTPQPGDEGINTFTVQVTDDSAGTLSGTATLTIRVLGATQSLLFCEDFEDPDVTCVNLTDYTKVAPQGWVRHSDSRSGMVDKACGAFISPDPTNHQAYVFRYTRSPGLTTDVGVITPGGIQSGETYRFTIEAQRDLGDSDQAYWYDISLVAYPPGANRADGNGYDTGTLVKHVKGTVPDDGQFHTISITYTIDPVADAALVGLDLAVYMSDVWEASGDDSALVDNVCIINGNVAPSFTATPIAGTAATEDAEYSGTIAGSATDPDGDSLTYAKVSGPDWLTIDSDGTLSGTPLQADVDAGVNTFTVSVTDGYSAPVETTLTITVNNTNDAPVFTADPVTGLTAYKDIAYSATIGSSATDEDGDSLTYAKVSGPDWLIIAGDGSLSGTPGSADLAAVPNVFTVSVTDSIIASPVEATLNITVLEQALTVSISPATISENGGTATATVTRNTDTTGVLTVSLGSDLTDEATVPVSGEIPAGETAADFTITAVDDSVADGTQTVTITASATGYVDGTATIDVTDDEFLVTYDGNENTGGAPPASQSKVVGNDLTLAADEGTLTLTGHHFTGWNTAADGTGTAYAAGATYSIDADVTLYAQWAPDTYTVSYNANTADTGTVPASQVKTYNVSLILRANTGVLTKTGYSFVGWNTAADGTGTDYAVGGTYTDNTAKILYANWAENLTWDANAAATDQIDGGGVWLGTDQWWDGTGNVTWPANSAAVFGKNGTGGTVTVGETSAGAISFGTFSGTYTLAKLNSTDVTFLDQSGGITTSLDSGNVTIEKRISGTGGLTVNTPGKIVILSNPQLDLGDGKQLYGSTYTGNTRVLGGIFQSGTSFNNSNSLSSGSNLEINGGNVKLVYYFRRSLGDGPGEFQITGGTSGFSQIQADTYGNLKLFNNDPSITVVWGANGEGSATGFFNPDAFVLNEQDAAPTQVVNFRNKLDLNGTDRTVATNATNTLSSRVDANQGFIPTAGGRITGVISNSGATPAGLIKTGPGLLQLTAANTYDGGNTVNEGTLQMYDSGTLGATSGALTINAGFFDLNDTNQTVGNLTGAGGSIANDGSGAVTLTIGSGDGTGGDYQGVIADNTGVGTGTLALTKTGAGALTLSGSDTYTGATAISAGKLFIDGDQSGATGDVTVASGATLGGTGTIGGDVNVAGGGKLEFTVDTVPASHDSLEIATGKTLAFAGASEVIITTLGSATTGTFTLVTGGNNITGTLPALTVPNGWTATLSISGNSLLLNLTNIGAPTWAVTYDANGGVGDVPVDSNMYPESASVTVLGNTGPLTKTGYSFDGWNTADDGSGTAYAAAAELTMPTETVILYAQWTINSYTITFDSAGGSAVADIVQNYGTTVTPPANPTKTGYTFDSWSPVVPGTMPAADTTCVAQWTINSYTISFDSDGGSAVADIVQDYGTTVTAPANPTKEGYTFGGWSPSVPATMPASNTNCVAQWTINSYTISFDSAGGSAVADIVQDYGTTVTAPADPTKTGYTFDSWSPVVPATMPAADTTCVAQWTPISFSVTYDANGATSGTAPDGQVKSYDIDLTLATNTGTLAKTSYTFDGWNTAADGSGTDYTEGAPYTANADVTLYAKWNSPPTVAAGNNQTVYLTGAVPWTPARITTIGWYDASDPNNVVVSGTNVTTWKDISGNGYDLDQTPTDPQYDGSQINGLNVIHFSSTLAEIYRSGIPDINCTEVCIVSVGEPKAAGDYPAMGTVYSTDTSDKLLARLQNNDVSGRTSCAVKLDGGSTISMSSSNSSDIVDDIPVMLATYYDGFNGVARVNGGALSKTTDAADGATFTINEIQAGRDSNTPRNYQGEMIVLNTTDLSTLQKVEGYLAWKWGLQDKLPADHPYKAMAPKTPTAVATLDGTVDDPDNDTLVTAWSKEGGPASAVTFNDSSAVDTTGTFTEPGVYTLRLTADDGYYQPYDEVTITVITSYSVTYDGNGATGGTAPVDQMKIQDVDLTLASNTGGLIKTGWTLDGWNTAADGTGTDYAVGATYSTNDYLALYAKWLNDPPSFTAAPFSATAANEYTAYSATIAGSATDSGDDPLTYALVSEQDWLYVAADGTLSGTPDHADVGLNTFTVSVTDDHGGSDTATLNIQVLPAGVTIAFEENFESPDVTGYAEGTSPDNGNWIRGDQGFGGTNHGIIDKDSGAFTVADPNHQGYAFRYTNSGITTAEGVIDALEAGATYTISFDGVKDGSITDYNCKLLAVPAGAARNDCRSNPTGSTLLHQETGNAPSDGTWTTVSFEFTPDPVTNADQIGQDMALRWASDSAAIIDNVKVVKTAPPSATPGAPVLVAAYDTGSSSVDNVTNLNNGPGKALAFDVSGLTPGARVLIYADGVLIGTAVAGETNPHTVITDGSTVLPDGHHVIQATQMESGKSESAFSASLAIIIDTTPPDIRHLDDMDTDFGVYGLLNDDASDSDADDQANAVALDQLGRIIVAGSVGAAPYRQLLVTRYSVDGKTVDTDFGQSGRVLIGNGTTEDIEAFGVAIESTGHIIVVGREKNGNDDAVVIRLDSNGGNPVKTAFNFGGEDIAYAVATQGVNENEKIVLAGVSGTNSIVARLNAEGTLLDTTFGINGKTIIPLGTTAVARTVAVDETRGRIVVAGDTTAAGDSDGFILCLKMSDGLLDGETFGTGGISIFGGGGTSEGFMAVRPEADGRIVAAGWSGPEGARNFAMVRCLAYGDLDTNFGGTGWATVDFGGDDTATGITTLGNGKFMLTGQTTAEGWSDMAAAVLNPFGQQVTDFGTAGKQIFNTSAGLGAGVEAAADDGFGGVVLAGWINGSTHRNSLVTRLQGAAWCSAADHGGTSMCENMTDGMVESRRSGIQSLEIRFAEPLITAQVPTLTIKDAVGTPLQTVDGGWVSADHQAATYTLAAALADQATYMLSVNLDAQDDAGNVRSVTRNLTISALVGDVNGDKVVNLADRYAIYARLGEPVTPLTCRFDLNGDGQIDMTDMTIAKEKTGNTAQ